MICPAPSFSLLSLLFVKDRSCKIRFLPKILSLNIKDQLISLSLSTCLSASLLRSVFFSHCRSVCHSFSDSVHPSLFVSLSPSIPPPRTSLFPCLSLSHFTPLSLCAFLLSLRLPSPLSPLLMLPPWVPLSGFCNEHGCRHAGCQGARWLLAKYSKSQSDTLSAGPASNNRRKGERAKCHQ